MLWHYALDGQQLGPVSDADLATLLREGKIDETTLVWREGMPDWQPLSVARTTTPPPATGLAGNKCVECGQVFPASQLITLNTSLVCAGCKPVFLQRLAEGVALPGSSGLWRQGKKIMTVSETPFPDRCVKCNAPANGYRLKRVLYWQHPAYYLLILCNLLVLLIVILIVRKKAVLHVGLCEVHRKQRLTAIIACCIGLFGGVVMMCVGGGLNNGWVALSGLAVFIGGIVWGAVKGRTIAASKIDKEKNVWVTGAGKEFLDDLPEAPH